VNGFLELRETLRLYAWAAHEHTEATSAETMARRPHGVTLAPASVSTVRNDGVSDGRSTLLDALQLADGDRLGPVPDALACSTEEDRGGGAGEGV
jgi:hypothetical protein